MHVQVLIIMFFKQKNTFLKIVQVFLHVSTAYCNCIRETVEEKIYPAPFDWRDAITLAENFDPTTSSVLTKM